MKKNFAPKFLPALINKTSTHWYISFYQTDPKTGIRKRFRLTFDLNRIKNKKIRLVRARQLAYEINMLLPHGYPFTSKLMLEGNISISEALKIGHKIKSQSDRARTIESYESLYRCLVLFTETNHLTNRPISEFGKKEAVQFMDWLILKREIGPRTYNNYLIRVKSMFNSLVEREYLYSNPFNDIKKKPVPEKTRRIFTVDEKNTVASYIRENDHWLYLAVVLIYYCYLRPVELRRLRFSHFDLINGTIRLSPDITKNKKWRYVTIPNSVIALFRKEEFAQWPINFLVFGDGLKPHPNKPSGRNTMNKRHNKILKHLLQQKKLASISGLTLYSWKDTGLTNSDASLYADMRQAGHQDPKITLIYKHEKMINEEMRITRKKL